MANQTVNYKCPSCGGPLHFDSASGKLKCDYCLSAYKPDEIAKMYGISRSYVSRIETKVLRKLRKRFDPEIIRSYAW